VPYEPQWEDQPVINMGRLAGKMGVVCTIAHDRISFSCDWPPYSEPAAAQLPPLGKDVTWVECQKQDDGKILITARSDMPEGRTYQVAHFYPNLDFSNLHPIGLLSEVLAA
jgi:hypothetical protein